MDKTQTPKSIELFGLLMDYVKELLLNLQAVFIVMGANVQFRGRDARFSFCNFLLIVVQTDSTHTTLAGAFLKYFGPVVTQAWCPYLYNT